MTNTTNGLLMSFRQSFHWFADLDSLREIHRVLRPHGALGLVWNVDSFNAPQGHTPKTAWEEAVRQIYWSFDDERPRFRHNKWRAVFDEQIKSSPLALLVPSDQLFSLPLGEESEEWVVRLPLEKMWERFTTYSHIAVLEGEEREVSKDVGIHLPTRSNFLDGEANDDLRRMFTKSSWKRLRMTRKLGMRMVMLS